MFDGYALDRQWVVAFYHGQRTWGVILNQWDADPNRTASHFVYDEKGLSWWKRGEDVPACCVRRIEMLRQLLSVVCRGQSGADGA